MTKVPMLLIWFRMLAGLALLLLSLQHATSYTWIAPILFTAGLLSDIFDGIIARHYNVSTQSLRRLDSAADQVFWALIIAATYVQYPAFFKENAVKIFIIVGAEVLTYVVSYARFRKEVATHAITSKLWTLTLFATLLQVMITGNSSWLFACCFYAGIASRAEVISILLIIRQWVNDVPTLYHAVQLRQGKPIKRNKLFNG